MRPRKPTVTNDPNRMCQYPRGDGGTCGLLTVRGKTFCTRHDPETRQKRAETQRGRARRLSHGQGARPVKTIASLDNLLDDLFIRHSQMSAYLDTLTANDEVDIDHFANLTNLHTNNATKIARLIKDKVDLAQLEAGALLDDALDLLSEEIELDL